MYSDQDIIVAQATPWHVRAPLAILRVSGQDCSEILKTHFVSETKGTLRPWRMAYGTWVDGQGVIDDVTVVAYQAPKSFTGQDMFEVFCHGNPLFVEDIIATIFKCGGRLAKPGEFTQRAVLHGKMDLLKAEGIHGLIESHTRYQAHMIRNQSTGPLLGFLKNQVEAMLQIQAHIEATIDYGEEDLDAIDQSVLLKKMEAILSEFLKLQDTGRFANQMQRGFKVLITGEPNVGKSTFFNRLVKSERAIVTELPGTTRDLISEKIEIGGLPIVLIDSAGVRDTDDVIETKGIEKIFEMLHEVDLVLVLSEKPHQQKTYPQVMALPKEKKLLIKTKSDLSQGLFGCDLAVSAKDGSGFSDLEKELVLRLSSVMEGQAVYLINQRQSAIIDQVVALLKDSCRDYESGFGEEIVSSYLNTARRLLGELTGETTVEDILDRMFSNFCLGK